MSIYQVNQWNAAPIFFVPDQAAADMAEPNNPNIGSIKIGTMQDAQAELQTIQEQVLVQESVRFSICANFQVPGGVEWRELQDTDPEDTVCQVFSTFTGQYTKYPSVTSAKAANAALQQQFLQSVGLGSVVEVQTLPPSPKQPTVKGAQTL